MRQCDTICIYCSSSDAVEQIYLDAANRIGELMACHNYTLLFGGAKVGLMGAVAATVHRYGGKIIGIIPKAMQEKGILYHDANEIIVVDDIRERKKILEERSDAFVALPGGFGTVEEILEIITHKQLHLHNKPVIFVNINGFYDCLISFFEHTYSEKFVKEDFRKLYVVINDVEDVFSYLDTYVPPKLPEKWYNINPR